jgi:hypothetical protein
MDSSVMPQNLVTAVYCVSQWSMSFDHWLPIHLQHVCNDEIPTLLSMFMWRTVINCILKAGYDNGKMAWDAMQSEFKSVVDCAEHFVNLTAEVVHEGEGWSHPLSYVRESAAARTAQSFTAQHAFMAHKAGPLTEDLLADLFASKPSALPLSDQRPSPLSPSEGPALYTLLRQAGTVVHRKRSMKYANGITQTSAVNKPIFTLSHGIVYPLFAVLIRCRDPQIRRRAQQVLETCNRHEGLWDSRLTAQLTKRMITIEETHALAEMTYNVPWNNEMQTLRSATIDHAQQIPSHCRIKAYNKTFLPDGRAVERFCLGQKGTKKESVSSSDGERWVEYVIDGI